MTNSSRHRFALSYGNHFEVEMPHGFNARDKFSKSGKFRQREVDNAFDPTKMNQSICQSRMRSFSGKHLSPSSFFNTGNLNWFAPDLETVALQFDVGVLDPNPTGNNSNDGKAASAKRICSRSLNELLRSTVKLEKLGVCFYIPGGFKAEYPILLEDLLAGVHLRRIQSLSLKGFADEAGTLISFLKAHNTLRSIRLTDFRVTSLESLFNRLRTMKCLKHIIIAGSGLEQVNSCGRQTVDQICALRLNGISWHWAIYITVGHSITLYVTHLTFLAHNVHSALMNYQMNKATPYVDGDTSSDPLSLERRNSNENGQGSAHRDVDLRYPPEWNLIARVASVYEIAQRIGPSDLDDAWALAKSILPADLRSGITTPDKLRDYLKTNEDPRPRFPDLKSLSSDVGTHLDIREILSVITTEYTPLPEPMKLESLGDKRLSHLAVLYVGILCRKAKKVPPVMDNETDINAALLLVIHLLVSESDC